MPIEFTPPRSLLDAYLRLRARARRDKPLANAVKTEMITAVTDDGMYTVRGKSIPATGQAVLNAGEAVDVAWKNGRPAVILAHNARRAQFHPVGAPVVNGLIEELFLFENNSTGFFEVWFRNQRIMVRIVENVPASSVASNNSIHWGLGSANYFCVENLLVGGTATVYRITNRPLTNEPFLSVNEPEVELVKTYNFGVINDGTGPVLGQMSVAINTGPSPGSGPIRWRQSYTTTPPSAIITASVHYGAIAPNGELIVREQIQTTLAAFASLFTSINGSMFVNAESGSVMHVHTVSLVQTILNPFDCGPGAVVTTTVSPSGTDADSGFIEILSLTMSEDAVPVPQITNYALYHAPTTDWQAACLGPDIRPATLHIRGQFAQLVATFLNPFIPFFQSSRTRMLYALQNSNSGIFNPALFMRDLAKGTQAIISTNPDLLFGQVFPNPLDRVTHRPIFCAQADLVYAPLDIVEPYNRQFFYGGMNRSTGAITLTLADPLKDPRLIGPLFKIDALSIEETVLFLSTSDSLQALDSKAVLSPLGMFRPGPL